MASISLVNEGLIPTTSQGIVLLASIISATAYIFAAFFLKRPVDGEGNPIPNGPIGVPIIGAFYSSVMDDDCLPQIQYRILPILDSLS
jgi:hypothetical protein